MFGKFLAAMVLNPEVQAKAHFTVGLLANIEKGLAGAIGPFLTDPGYMDRLGLHAFNKTQFGLITTLFYFSFILMTFVAGWFVDRYGYRIFVPVALLILAVGSAFFGFAGTSPRASVQAGRSAASCLPRSTVSSPMSAWWASRIVRIASGV